ALLPPGTLATGIPRRRMPASSSRSSPAPVTCTSFTRLPANRSAGSLGPTAGMMSASVALIPVTSWQSDGEANVIARVTGGRTPTRRKSASGRKHRTECDIILRARFALALVLEPCRDLRHGEKAQQYKWHGTRIAGDVHLSGRNEDGIAGLERIPLIP